MIEILACLAIGYVCGNLLTAELVARHELHRSAFEVGVGNPGMANMGHELGLKAAAVTLAGDLGKVVVATIICSLAFPALGSDAAAWAGLGATLGHNFPAWHHFRGGKGVATTGATIVLASPGWGFLALIIGLATVVFSGYLCVGAIAITASYAVFMLIAGDFEHVIVAAVLLALMIYAHGSAVAGIRTGETPRASLSDKVLSMLPFDLHRKDRSRRTGDGAAGRARTTTTATGAPGRSDNGGFFTRGPLSQEPRQDMRLKVPQVEDVSPGDTLAYPRTRAIRAQGADAPAPDVPETGTPRAQAAPDTAAPQTASPEATAVPRAATSRAQAAPARTTAPTGPAPETDPRNVVDKTVAMPRVVAAPAPQDATARQGAPAPQPTPRRRIDADAMVTPRAARPRTARPSRPSRPAPRAEAPHMRTYPMTHVQGDATARPQPVRRQRAEAPRQAYGDQRTAEDLARLGRFVGDGARAAGKGIAHAGRRAMSELSQPKRASENDTERRRTLERRRQGAATREETPTRRVLRPSGAREAGHDPASSVRVEGRVRGRDNTGGTMPGARHRPAHQATHGQRTPRAPRHDAGPDSSRDTTRRQSGDAAVRRGRGSSGSSPAHGTRGDNSHSPRHRA